MNIYFKGIRALNPEQNLDEIINIHIVDGKIIHSSQDEANISTDTKVIDSKGLVCSPGLFDMHVHFREPGFEHKETIESGSYSAANGGFTGVVVMPNTEPALDDLTVVEYVKSKSRDLPVDVHCSAAITKGRKGTHITEMLSLAEAGVVLFTDDGDPISDAGVMRLAFDYASTHDLLLSQHAEETSLTKDFAMDECKLSYELGLKGYPAVAEEIIVARDLMLAGYCGNRRYHVQHISTKGTVELMREAKSKGLRASCEVAPHHFVLTHNEMVNYNPNYKMNPPLRSQDDIDEIIKGIQDGTIDCIATDHAPHSLHEKDVELENAPNGIIGLETSLGVSLTKLYHSGIIDLNRLIEMMAINPRKLLNLELPEISSGVNANLTIFAPDEEWTVDLSRFKTKSKNSPFGNFKLKGKPKFVINKNQFIESDL
jgi:dihydroorotase